MVDHMLPGGEYARKDWNINRTTSTTKRITTNNLS